MFKKILIGLVVLVGGFAAFVATRPSTFHVERSATIKAPPEVLFGQVADFHKWQDWSPWEKLDPTMKKTYSGPSSGEGAAYAWVGNDKVGEGDMTITSAQPNEKISIRLEFLKPWKAVNTATFTFKPAGDITTVTWAMDGEHNYVGKAFALFMNMDQMIGGDFDKGLAGLAMVSEAEAKKKAEEAAKAAAAPTPAASTDGAKPVEGAATPAAKDAKPAEAPVAGKK
jgi:uncharacterized protein YndB with AHSA1/START domain